jgi:hypothetical protein
VSRWLAAGGLAAVMSVPVTWPMVRDYAQFADQSNRRRGSIANSPDLLAFFVPERLFSRYGHRAFTWVTGLDTADVYANLHGSYGERQAYLGYGVMLPIVASWFVVPWHKMWRWWLIAGLSVSLIAGPVLYVANRAIAPMPYSLILRLPFAGFGRTPGRFSVILMLLLAIIAGEACAALARRSAWFKPAIVAMAALIFVEFIPRPWVFDPRHLEMSQFYHQIAADGETGAILEVPVDIFTELGPGVNYLVYQTVHHRPMVDGYIARTPRLVGKLFDRPFVNQLRYRIPPDAEPYQFTPEMLAQGLADIESLDVEYVILHKDATWLPEVDFPVVNSALVTVLGPPTYEDDALIAWRLSDDG